MYSEINPSIGLKKSVENFWFLTDNKLSEAYKICPDACTDLIFDLNINKVYLSAAMNTYQQIAVPAMSNLIGIRFKSESFGSILGIPLDELKNKKIELSDLLPRFDYSITDELNISEPIYANINKLENFVARVVAQNFDKRDEVVISMANRIRQLGGSCVIKDLASSYSISMRQLQRRFKQYVGLNIKEFSNVVRLKNTERSIKNCPERSLMEIAFEMGYYDHSHMHYEFQRIVGESPNIFR